MQASGNSSVPWNRYQNDWQESWNGGWNSQAWYEQPAKGSYAHNQDAYGSWPPSAAGSHAYRQGENGYGGRAQATLNQSQESKPSTQALPPPSQAKPCSFDALRALQGDDGSDDSEAETSAHDSAGRFFSDGSATTAKTDENLHPSDDKQANVGKEATQAEREEAEEVVRTAFNNVKERDSMRSKVSTASPSDLQAMLNARLKKQSSQ